LLQNCQASASTRNFNGSRVFAHSLFIKSKRGSRGEPLAFGDFGDIYQKNPFLGIFQLKFCLNTFETCSLLYVCVLKFSILAIILFECLLFDPSAKRGPKLSRGLKNFRCARATCPLFSAPMGLLQA